MKEASRGPSIALELEHLDRYALVAVRCLHDSKVTLCFVLMKNDGSTKREKSHEIKFADSHRNVYVRLVDWPTVASNFFEVSNVVDKHNHARQHELILEKK